MNENQETRSLKGTWNQAILTFLFPILLVMGVRWALFEPFVIPSGSMIPNLLIHDHVIVKKFSYGLHVPFGNKWLLQWQTPERGEVVVFKYPENPDVYYIKRLIGLPGDTVEVKAGRVTVNGKKWELQSFENPANEKGFNYFTENNGQRSYVVRFLSDENSGEVEAFKVPEGQYFFMGDNRDQSSDSRYWGFVKNDYLVGRAWIIWLSCNSTLPTMTFVCDPSQIRFNRLFQSLQ
ncbi:signal peptidase I [Bdellovibrio sp. 22V]|uniref:signal peptidase I n=1 Tax=Bdellovibrio sp. 22V TaxID=3044166 RepID=UPI002543A74B|nr:signal peptidase I [Bdellovibrio sp. 22V]WII73434.1 signal peptidase I [Bdellovibrio sp. 22V]